MAHILIIDDDKLVRESVQIMLQGRGHKVSSTSDGRSGIDTALAGGFDLAIVDLFIGDMDGLAVMKAIRQAKPDLPMIAASGFMFRGNCPQMPEFERLAFEAGATSTLYKPLRPKEVLSAIDGALSAADVIEPRVRPDNLILLTRGAS
jgi:CheY-like chemotaxis protein